MLSLVINDDLRLRMLEENQAAELFKLVNANRRHLNPWLPWVETTKTVVDSRRFIAENHQKYREGTLVPVGIWYRNQLVGHASMMDIEANHETEVGYWIAGDFEGKGIITQAVAGLVDYAFTELKLERIEIRCRTNNSRSRAVPERLGFTREGTLRHAEYIHGKHYDAELYSLLASE
jgi:ribosomal-protein-serine acetyltransferase